MNVSSLTRRFTVDIRCLGFALVSNVVRAGEIDALIEELSRPRAGGSIRGGKMYAARNLLATVPAVAKLAVMSPLRSLAECVLGPAAFPVRAILFDKLPGANWQIGWHQDQVIAINTRKEVPGFTAWSIKRGIPHARPPVYVLERMLTLRVHLDECNESNGALQVIPGSHANGLLDDSQIQEIVGRIPPRICAARSGDVLAIRPLLLHSSAPAAEPGHRRVIHLEYAAEPLPGGLEWPEWNPAWAAATVPQERDQHGITASR
jgi:hypothetical protein